MGQEYTPEEKRLRGFLSGDPERVARTTRRCAGVSSIDIHRFMASHLSEIVAATTALDLAPDDRAELDAYLQWLQQTGSFDPNPNSPPPCQCQTYRSSRSDHRLTTTVLSAMTHSGWSEAVIRCDLCQRSYNYEEDVGYHVPQYRWLPTR